MKLVLLVALLGVAYVAAECPEACNGHGFCGEYDKCSCYRNWQGNSCADRTCPSDVAFVDLPKGDLNMDGNLDDTITKYGAQINDIYAFEVYPTDGYQINRNGNVCYLEGTCSTTTSTKCSGDNPDDDCPESETCTAGSLASPTTACDTAADCTNANAICGDVLSSGSDISGDDIMYSTLTSKEKAASFYDQAEDGHFYAECSNKGMCDRKSGQCDCFDGYSGTACRRVACPNDCSGHGTCETIAETSADGASYTYQLWDRYKTQVCSCDPGYFGIDCAQRHCPYGDDPLSADEHNEIQWLTLRTHGDGSWGPVDGLSHKCAIATATACTADTDCTVETNDYCLQTSYTPGDLDLEGTFRLAYKDEYGETWNTSPIGAFSYDISTAATNTNLAAAIKAALQGIPNSVFEEVDVEIWPIQLPIPGLFACTDGSGSVVGTDAVECVLAEDATAQKVENANVPDFAKTSEQTAATDGSISVAISSDELTGADHKWGISNCLQTGTSGAVFAEGAVFNSNGKIHAESGLGTAPTSICRYDMNGFRAKITFTSNPGDLNELTCDADLVTTPEHSDSAAPNTDIVCTAKDQLNFELGAVNTVVGSTIGGGNGGQIQTNMDLSAMVNDGDRIVFGANTCTIAGPVNAPATDATAKIICEEEFAATAALATINTPAAHWLGKGTTENVECSHRGLCNHDEGLCECFTGYTHDDCSRQDALNA